MARAINPGIPVHGEINSADASAGVTYTLYDNEGVVIPPPASYQITIEQFFVFSVAGGRVAIANGTDTAGNRLRGATLPANAGLMDSCIEIVCKKNTTPKLFAAAGQVDSQFEGRFIKLG